MKNYENDLPVQPLTTHIFIDESGDLGKFGSKFFVIAALSTHDPLHLARIIKKARRKFLKTRSPEIKGNNSNDKIRKFVLSSIARCNCQIYIAVIAKDKVVDSIFSKNSRLYNYLCGILFEFISLNTQKAVVIIDKKDSNRLIREDFNRYIERKIRDKSPTIMLNIAHLESHGCKELLAVDFVAWAVNRRYTTGDAAFYNLIRSRIRNADEEEIWGK